MTSDCLKLTVYFGERDRLNGHLTSDVLLDLHERHGVKAAILVRATEGFGIKHQLHTQRMLTLSENLPLVSIAVDTRETIERLVPEFAGTGSRVPPCSWGSTGSCTTHGGEHGSSRAMRMCP